MTTSTLTTAQEKIDAGLEPRFFWISSEGEISHRWSDDSDSYPRAIGYDKMAEIAGVPWTGDPRTIPFEIRKRENDRAERAELIDPRENILVRLHEHMRGVGSDLWRVYAGIEYKTPAEVTLRLITELVLDEKQKAALERLCLPEAGSAKAGLYHGFEVRVDVMHQDFDNPDLEQIEIEFNILGKSYGEVCALQLAFLNDPVVLGFEGSFVSVL